MKKFKFIVPVLACLALLSGCATAPKLSEKNVTITESYGDTYQSIFKKLYSSNGLSVTEKELLYTAANYILDHSDFWNEKDGKSTTRKEREIESRIVDQFNALYIDTYKEDGLFKETLLAQYLRKTGYTIEENGKKGFEETVKTLVGNKDLKTLLQFDYSDYIEEKEKDIVIDLLKEEYVRTQKGLNSDSSVKTSFYTGKEIRNVEYFYFTADNSSERIEYTDKIKAVVEEYAKSGTKSFKELVENDLEVIWKTKKLEDAAKEFAAINKEAFEGKAVYEAFEEYDLPETYKAAVKAAELKYATDEKYGFKDIYTAEGKKELTDETISATKTKLNSYSSNGTQSIYKGYFLKQIDILSKNYYNESVYTNDASDIIDSDVTEAIQDLDFYSEDKGILDIADTNSCVYISGNSCYVVVASKLADEKFADYESVIKACKELATVSSNVKNCWYYYLTSLNEDKVLTIHWQDLYDVLNETYSFGEED